jgi:glucan phosphoethanolaminetransferase (alkaline phosphatase superfamily)
MFLTVGHNMTRNIHPSLPFLLTYLLTFLLAAGWAFVPSALMSMLHLLLVLLLTYSMLVTPYMVIWVQIMQRQQHQQH